MKDDRLYLLHMLECAGRIGDYTGDGRDAFMTDRRTQDAVIRNFEILGEAAKQVSDATRDRAPAIPWRRIAGFRDVLIHHYMGVNLEEVWGIVEQHLPSIIEQLEKLLKDTEQEGPGSAHAP